MNGRTNVAIQWIRKRLAGHAYTVWFGLGIVVTVAIQRFGEFIAEQRLITRQTDQGAFPFGEARAVQLHGPVRVSARLRDGA